MPGSRHPRPRCRPLLALLALLLAAWPTPAPAQLADILFDVDRAFVGIGGFVRPGQWTPLRVTLANQSAELREVRVQWVLPDEDGDRVIAQRIATLNPGRADAHVWLYACPPHATRAESTGWRIQVLDHRTGRALGDPLPILPDPARFMPPEQGLIGIMSSINLGLLPHAFGAAAHEQTRLATGLRLDHLPDRWFGLASFPTLIWTYGDGEGGDPNDSAFTPDQQEALRQWVKRGGHLVIVLPAYGEPWSGSPLADLMPLGPDRMRRVEDLPPVSLGLALGAERAPVTMTVFDPRPGSGVEVIERDRAGNAVVVAHRLGFGTVTLIGVDLADRSLVAMGLPNGRWTIWNQVFGWRSPAFTESEADAETRRNDMVDPRSRHGSLANTRIGFDWLPGVIDMRGTATPALLLAILVFIIYWLLAGPGVYAGLRARGWHHHTWIAFVAIVGVFTLVTWSGALLFRKGDVSVAHFSVLDIDGNTGQVRSRGWMSLFLPQFGSATVAIDPDNPDQPNTLASPGIVSQLDAGRFPDQQSYIVLAASPNAAPVPVRATAKRFVYDFAGTLDQRRRGLSSTWEGPSGTLSVVNAWPQGELTHGLPGTLRDMVVVYCPGGGQVPWVWFHRDPWEPGKPLSIDRPNQALRLNTSRTDFPAQRDFAAEGYLGQLIDLRTGMVGIASQMLPTSNLRRDTKQQVEMLSFFDALPPPNFRSAGTGFGIGQTFTFHRHFGRDMDITPLTRGKRIILIGYLGGAAPPVPLTVDDQPITSTLDNSWTVVRWVYDLE